MRLSSASVEAVLLAVLGALGSGCAPDTGGSADGGLADLCGPTGDLPADLCGAGGLDYLPSTQSVTFRLNNGNASERVVATAGFFCSSFLIEQRQGSGYVPLSLQLPFQYACEVASPGAAYVSAFRSIPAGGTFNVRWDARTLATCASVMTCNQECHWHPTIVHQGALQPVPAGDYRFSIEMANMVPSLCTLSGSSYECHSEHDDPLPFPMVGPGGLCDAAHYPTPMPAFTLATAAFTLPQSGDLTVDVALP